MRDFHFLEPLSDYSIIFLVNGSANGCKNIMLYLEGSLGKARMQGRDFEIDVIELLLNLHKIFFWAVHFLIFSFLLLGDWQLNNRSRQKLSTVLLMQVYIK